MGEKSEKYRIFKYIAFNPQNWQKVPPSGSPAGDSDATRPPHESASFHGCSK